MSDLKLNFPAMQWFGIGFCLVLVGVAIAIASLWIGVAVIVLGGFCQVWAFLGTWLEWKRNNRLFQQANDPAELLRLGDQLIKEIQRNSE